MTCDEPALSLGSFTPSRTLSGRPWSWLIERCCGAALASLETPQWPAPWLKPAAAHRAARHADSAAACGAPLPSTWGAPLLARLRSRGQPRMRSMAALFEDYVEVLQRACRLPPPSPVAVSIEVTTTLPRIRSRARVPEVGIRQEAAAVIDLEPPGQLLVYTDGSVFSTEGRGAAACTVPARGGHRHMPTAVPRQLHSGRAGRPTLGWGRAARGPTTYQRPLSSATPGRRFSSRERHLCYGDKAANPKLSLVAKLRHLLAEGCSLRLQWLPAHVGIPGSEAAYELAKAARDSPMVQSARPWCALMWTGMSLGERWPHATPADEWPPVRPHGSFPLVG